MLEKDVENGAVTINKQYQSLKVHEETYAGLYWRRRINLRYSLR